MALTTVDQGLLGTYAQYTGFKNRIINGAMMIDQRNAGASVTPASAGANNYTLDRWSLAPSQASKFSIQQNAGAVTPPVGFTAYLGATSLSAYSVGASDYFQLVQYIEGNNCSDLAWGTANAKTVTLSFQVYSSLTGTFGGALTNSAGTRSYPFTYTVSSANTWTTVSVTVAGDTSGTWLTTNGIGIAVRFGLGVGSTYSGTAGAWAGSFYLSATGATSVVGTNGATFYITGVQLEKGSTATSFDYRPYGTELALCQRYYEKSFPIDIAPQTVYGDPRQPTTREAGFWYAGPFTYAAEKRATPTHTFYSPTGLASANAYYVYAGGAWGTATTGAYLNTTRCFTVSLAAAVGANTQGGIASGWWVASAEL